MINWDIWTGRYYHIRCTLKPPVKAAASVEVEKRLDTVSGKLFRVQFNQIALFWITVSQAEETQK